MSIFFTPVEIKRSSPKSENPYQYNKYNDDPFKMTEFSVESITDQKKKIINWLKKLSPLDRFDYLTYSNKQFVCLVLQMFKRKQEFQNDIVHFSIFQNQSKQFGLIHKVIHNQVKQNIVKAQVELLNALVIMNKYTRFDSLSLNQQMTKNIDRLFQLFQIIEDGISHQLTQQQYYKEYKKHTQKNTEYIFYRPKQTQQYAKSIGMWIVQILKKNISIQFFKEKQKEMSIDSSQPQQSSKIFSSKQYSKNFQKAWKSINYQEKKQLLQKIMQIKIVNLMFQYRQIVKVHSDCYPTVFQNHNYQIDQNIQKLLQCQPSKVFFLISLSTIRQTQQSYSYYKYQIFQAIEEKIKKLKKSTHNFTVNSSKNKNITRSQSLRQQIIVQIQTNDQINFTKKIPIEHQTQNINKNFSKGNQMFYDYEQGYCATNNQYSQDKQSFMKLNKKKKKKNKRRTMTPKDQDSFEQKNKNIENKSEKGFIMSSQTTTLNQNETSDASQIQKIEKNYSNYDDKQQKIQSDFEKQSNQSPKKEEEVTSQNDKLFEEILNKINYQTGLPNKYRKIITNRMGLILSHLNLSYKLYGSFACGLALANSDIDISVDPTIVHYFYAQFCSYRQKIVKSLQFLKGILKPMKWISDLNIIPGASIPILSFNANPLQPYQASPKDSRLNILRNKNKGMAQINVDLTIDSFVNMTHQIAPHLGFQATMMMKEWINVYPEIVNIKLFMKQIFFTHSLNKVYTGGLSSFTLMILIVVHLKLQKVKSGKNDRNIKNVDRVLRFLKFLAQFDQKLYGIDIRRQKDMIFKKIQNNKMNININNKNISCNNVNNSLMNKVVIISPLNGSNMSQNCYFFEKIKQVCKQSIRLLQNKEEANIKREIKNDNKEKLMKLVFGG